MRFITPMTKLFAILRYFTVVRRRHQLRAWIEEDGTLVLLMAKGDRS